MLKKIMLLGCLLALFLGAGCGKETNKTEQVHVLPIRAGWKSRPGIRDPLRCLRK